MPATWKTVRVFISSTFRDMHAERDWLVKRVFPALRERLQRHRIHLIDIDLRWGVTEEEAQQDRVLDLCLSQIDECRPFFVGILGERYGWVPQTFTEEAANKYGWVQYHTGKSVTELEFVYGVLRDPEMHGLGLFFFRDPAFIDDVPAAKQRDLRAEDEASARKLATLKQAIRDTPLTSPPFENYPCRYAGLRINWQLARVEIQDEADRAILQRVAEDGIVDPQEYAGLDDRARELVHRFGAVHLEGLEAFGQRVQDQLWQAIQRKYDLPDAPPAATRAERDPLAEEAAYHEEFIESRLRVYVGREQVQDRLMAFAEGGETQPCLVTGRSGSGKSAALARFARSYAESHPSALVIPHFVGASPSSTNLRQMLRRICLKLRAEFGFDEEVQQEVSQLVTTFRMFAENVPAGRRVVLVLDALNQLDESDNAHSMHWLPPRFPEHVKLIASCIDDPDQEERVLQAFEHRPRHRIELGPLTERERLEILRQVPSLSAKTLDDVQVGLLLANSATENPLFLLVALEELRGFGSFEHLDRRIAQLPHPHGDNPGFQRWMNAARHEAQAMADEARRRGLLARLEAIESTRHALEPVDDPLTSVFLQVIERLVEEFDRVVVQDVLSLLAVARRGLSQRELLDLVEGRDTSIADSRGDLFPALRQLRAYLQPRGELLDFYHRGLYKAVRSRLLHDDESRSAAHARLAEYFGEQDYFLEPPEEQRARARRLPPTPRPANVRKVDELPWHVLQVAKLRGKDDPQSPYWDAVADLFTELHFLEAKAEAQPEGRA